MTRLLVLAAALVSAATLSAPALAGGGRYTFDGGTSAQQATVRAALNASSFDWNLVPATIAIHIVAGSDTEAAPGEIWLDPDLLSSGEFAWGTIQHEYAHQVDFSLLDDQKRAQIAAALGGASWLQPVGGAPLQHGDMTAERFASSLAWAYWPSTYNSMKPRSNSDEAGAMKPASFRALVAGLLGSSRTLASAKVASAR
jgi:hypothetical protein